MRDSEVEAAGFQYVGESVEEESVETSDEGEYPPEPNRDRRTPARVASKGVLNYVKYGVNSRRLSLAIDYRKGYPICSFMIDEFESKIENEACGFLLRRLLLLDRKLNAACENKGNAGKIARVIAALELSPLTRSLKEKTREKLYQGVLDFVERYKIKVCSLSMDECIKLDSSLQVILRIINDRAKGYDLVNTHIDERFQHAINSDAVGVVGIFVTVYPFNEEVFYHAIRTGKEKMVRVFVKEYGASIPAGVFSIGEGKAKRWGYAGIAGYLNEAHNRVEKEVSVNVPDHCEDRWVLLNSIWDDEVLDDINVLDSMEKKMKVLKGKVSLEIFNKVKEEISGVLKFLLEEGILEQVCLDKWNKICMSLNASPKVNRYRGASYTASTAVSYSIQPLGPTIVAVGRLVNSLQFFSQRNTVDRNFGT